MLHIPSPDYLHSRAFVRDWNHCRRSAYTAFFEAYWSRMYLLCALHLKDDRVEERAASTFEHVFDERITSFDDLLDKTFRKARALACPGESPEDYDPAIDQVHVAYLYQVKVMIEKKHGPFKHTPSADDWRGMLHDLKNRGQ